MVQLVYCKQNVSLRLDEDSSILGYFGLCRFDNEYGFIWVTLDGLTDDQSLVFKQVLDITKTFDFNQSIPNIPLEIPGDLTEFISTPLSQITCIILEPRLTLYSQKEMCLPYLLIKYKFGALETHWPELWVEPMGMNIETAPSFQNQLRLWIRTCKMDLKREAEQAPFIITAELQPLSSPFSSKWPSNLPEPNQDSSVYQFGKFGLGMINNIAGEKTAEKVEGFGWSVLERFSRVTNIARDKTTQVLSTKFARPFLPLIPTQVRNLFLSSQEVEELLKEYDSAEHYLSKFAHEIQDRMGNRANSSDAITELDVECDFENLTKNHQLNFFGHLLTTEKWAEIHDENGKLTVSPLYIKSLIFCGLWKYIFGLFPWESTTAERKQIMIDKTKEFNEIKKSWMDILDDAASSSPVKLTAAQVGPVGDENLDSDVVGKLRERKYRIDKDVIRTDRNVDFYHTSTQMVNPDTGSPLPIDTAPHLLLLRDILITYTMVDFEIGYVQGMNDLAAPLVACIDDETSAFWCFVGFMQRMKDNFLRDQSGMRTQLRQLELLIKFLDFPLYQTLEMNDATNLFCCFRWVLILFKREFSFDEIKYLWEAIVVCPLTKRFNLFIAFSILNMHRSELMICRAFDEVLRYVNDLSGKLSAPDVIQRAQSLFFVFRDEFTQFSPPDLAPIPKLLEVDDMLGQITGKKINHVINPDKSKPKLTTEEWTELVTIFEM